MRVHVNHPGSARALVRFYRTRGYLSVERSLGVVEAIPISSAGEAADRARLLADLDAWLADNPDVKPLERPERPADG